MMKKAILAASVSLIAHSASAFYAGVNVGHLGGDIKTPHSATGEVHHGMNNMLAGVSVGHGMPISKFLSVDVELGYGMNIDGKHKTDKANDTTNEIKSTMYVDAHLHYHLSNAMSIYGLVGFGQSEVEFDYWDGSAKSAKNVDLRGLRFGAGFDAMISKKMSFYGQAVITNSEGKSISGLTNTVELKPLSNTASVGVRYTF